MRGVAVAGVLLASACAFSGRGHPEVRRAATQEEAGSVHFAVLAVGPWEQFVDALQPEFDLTPEAALARVLAPTRISSRHAEDSFGVRIGVGAEPAEGASPKREAVLPDTPLRADAMTQYWAATALYQEVHLLSQVLRHAAIRKNTKPYVLRMQVTLLPRRRRLPYDAYTTISFFPAGEGDTAEWSTRGLDIGDDPQPTEGGGTAADSEAAAAGRTRAAAAVPEVLPILVTDSLEAGVAAVSSRSARDIALAIGGQGGSVGVDAARGLSDAAAGLDLNSLLTVARVSDNTLRVRLGALQQGNAEYAMVPRTHNITVLVMMPENVTRLHLVVRTVMVDAETGEELPRRDLERVDALLEALEEEYGVAVDDLRVLLGHAQRNEAAAFFAEAAAKGAPQPRSLWLDLVSVATGGQYAASIVDLEPDRRAPASPVFPPDQSVLVTDDGAHCHVVLQGGAHLRRERLQAWLLLPREGEETLEILLLAPPALSAGGRTIHLAFPSLHTAQLDPARLRLRLEHGGEPVTYRRVVYVPPPKKR